MVRLAANTFMLIAICACGVFVQGVIAQSKPKTPDWSKGDYGSVISVPIDVAERANKDTTDISKTVNYVFRGRVISLTSDKKINIAYDLDHLRVAGVWTGGYVDYKGASKNMGPSVKGKILFATKPAPGWAGPNGQWDDPRPHKEGPLPADWAKYRGMYVHGDKVVLAYTVGDTRVLEMPSAFQAPGGVVIVRHFDIQPTKRPLAVLIAHSVNDPKVFFHGEHLPAGATIETKNGRTVLTLPKHNARSVFSVYALREKPSVSQPAFPLDEYVKGGPARFAKVLETQGKRSTRKGAYVADDLTPPWDNSWRSRLKFGALDFFDDGRAAIATWDGDVWIVSGIDDTLSKLKWKRFAVGLQHPLGLRIVDGMIYTAGRDQITRLRDLNGDGEADYYENFNNDAAITLQRHEYVLDLHTDKDGNFFYCRSGHYIKSPRGDNCVVFKLSKDGKKLEQFAHGFREPNGMGISPDGFMTVGDNEGNGIPATPIYHLQKGKFYGFTPPSGTNRRGGKFKLTEQPLVWLPKKVDRSAGSQLWVTGNKWGPFSGSAIHTSYGNCRMYAMLLDRKNNKSNDTAAQAAIVAFPLAFNSGVMRARVHPKDGQVYLCGLKGWDTNAVFDGQFCRVRYTGKPVYMPTAFQVTKAGIDITFASKLDPNTANDTESFGGHWTTNPKGGGDEIPITAAKLHADGKTVSLTMDGIRPGLNFDLSYDLDAADGELIEGTMYGRVNFMR